MRIKEYHVTRLTERAMDVQLEFAYPESLATSQSDPDQLIVHFKNADLFVDKSQGLKLEPKL